MYYKLGQACVTNWGSFVLLQIRANVFTNWGSFIIVNYGKLIYFMRTVPKLGDLMKPLESIIRLKFIPSITGGHICSDDERKLLLLPTRYGSLAISLFHKIASFEYENSKKLTIFLSQIIKDQSKVYHVNEMDHRKIKSGIKSERQHHYKNTLNELRNNMSDSQVRLNNVSQEKGVSNWLTPYPISEHGFDLNKQKF